MRKRKVAEPSVAQTRIFVGDEELSAAVGLGRNNARRLAEEAGAVRYFGSRRLTHLQTVVDYLNNSGGTR